MEKGIKFLLGVVAAFLIITADSCLRRPIYNEKIEIPKVSPDVRIQVALTRFSARPSIHVYVRGGFELKGPEQFIKGNDLECTISYKDGKLLIGGFFFEDSPVRLSTTGARIKFDTTQYYGSMIFHFSDRFLIVNEVPLEKYLEGVIVREMSANWPKEALKAQTIAARAYALYEMRSERVRSVEKLFDLYDDERSQVYIPEEPDQFITDLIEGTKGMVPVYNDKVVYTLYSSTCGGHTEPAWEALDVYPRVYPLSGVSCSFCKGSKYYNWSTKFSLKEASQKLLDGQGGLIKSINVTKKSKGGHALEVSLKVNSKEIKMHANLEFRRKLGTRQLKSTLFDSIILSGDQIEVTGRGWGHAAGMCQTGAKKMAEEGYNYQRILLHYYPGTEIRRLNGTF